MAAKFVNRIREQEKDDFFKEKAEMDYLKRQREHEADEAAAVSKVAWKRRVNESAWVLNADLLLFQEKTEAREKRIKDRELFNLEQYRKAEMGARLAKSQRKGILNSIIGAFGGGFHIESATEDELNPGREKDEETIRKEQLANHLVEMEDRRRRNKFLKDNAANIIILERSKQLLQVSRLPAHHKAVKLLPDYEEPFKDGSIDKERLANLSYYERPKPKSIVEDPKDYKSVEQVKREDMESKRFIVSGRHHNYLGAERLYPLRSKPQTVNALYAIAAAPDLIKYPEDKLLPNREDLAKAKSEEEYQKTLLKKITTVRKGALKMSRNPVKFFPLSSSQQNSLYGDRSLSPSDDGSVGRTRPPKNQQFQWSSKEEMSENNPHYGKSHPPVVFMSSPGDSSDDSSVRTGRDSVRFHLEPPLPRKEEQSNLRMRQSVSPDKDHDSSHMETDGAVRSNFQSLGSLPEDILIPVHMQRHRGARQLDRFHIKDLNLMSTKEKRKRERAQRMARMAATSGVSIGSGAVGGDGGLRSIKSKDKDTGSIKGGGLDSGRTSLSSYTNGLDF